LHDYYERSATYRAAQRKRAERDKKRAATVALRSQDKLLSQDSPNDGVAVTGAREREDQRTIEQGCAVTLTGDSSSSKGEEDPIVFTITCSGDPKAFDIKRSQRDAWATSFPGVDVDAVLRKADQWQCDNPRKRKTARSMLEWIAGTWLAGDQDSGK